MRCGRISAALSGEWDGRHSVIVYRERYENLLRAINLYYWDEAQGAYIDSFVSGKAHVTRHANIFAIRYGIADAKQREKIVFCVLQNDRIPVIITSYFKFYELDVLGTLGYLDLVMEEIRSYWGGMLERGAVTFWEEYDPTVIGEEQYDMYGDRAYMFVRNVSNFRCGGCYDADI